MAASLIWPVACLVAGLTLVVLEVFIPSGGLIGFLSIGLISISLWLAFGVSTTVGLIFVGLIVLLVPAALSAAFWIFPRTPMGRWLLLRPPAQEDRGGFTTGGALEHLIGQFGRTLTPLRPSGLVDFEGRRLDGLSEDGLIPAGILVRAVRVRGAQVVVRVAGLQSLEDLDTPRVT